MPQWWRTRLARHSGVPGWVGGPVGHAQRCHRGVRSAGRVGDVAFDQPDLVDVRERQVGRCGEDLDGAGGDSAVAGVDVAQRDWSLGPGQRVERGEERRLVLLEGEHEPRAAFVQVLGVGALGMECVCRDHRAGQVATPASASSSSRGANIGISLVFAPTST
jgi:hypothetical protein